MWNKQKNRERGVTLVEVIICAALFSILLFAFINLINSSLDISVKAGDITLAVLLAQEKMEELLATPYADLPAEGLSIAAPLNFGCGLQYYCSITVDMIEFDGYMLHGLLLEVAVLSEGGEQIAGFTSFRREEYP